MNIARSTLLALALGTLSSVARADLQDDAAHLAKAWSKEASVDRLAPLFLEHGRARVVKIDTSAKGAADCLTVGLVTVRTAELAVTTDRAFSAVSDEPRAADPLHVQPPPAATIEGDARVRSAGGLSIVARCGETRAELRHLVVELSTARAAMEIVVARSPRPLAAPRDALPERALGLTAPRGDPGGPIEPGPIADRLARSEKRARDAGALHVTRIAMKASENGAGEFDLKISAGCHRVEIMAEVPQVTPRRATDLDAEAKLDSGRLLARDRADVPDVRLDFCLGEASLVEIPFVGASGAVSVTLSDAVFPIAKAVPEHFGARARAGFATALSRRKGPDPSSRAIFEAAGAQTSSFIPVPVEPGRCYLAAVGLVRGEARKLRITARVGDSAPRDEVVDRPEGAAVAFCSKRERVAALEVEAIGSTPWWAVAVWPMGNAP